MAEEQTVSADKIRLLFLGDIFGEPGRKAVSDLLPKLMERHRIDFAVVNGENAAGGRGPTPRLCIQLLRAGAAVVTLGDHAWDDRDIIGYMQDEPRVLRPINYPDGVPGQGSVVLETPKGKVAVLCGQGRVFMQPPLENPFLAMEKEVRRLREETKVILADFHAEATSEKCAIGFHLDGLVSGIFGTHTHVQTADERILPGGTAFMADAGMCGPLNSVIGSNPDEVLGRFRTGLPARLHVGHGPVVVCGAWIEVDIATGRALSIERIREFWEGT